MAAPMNRLAGVKGEMEGTNWWLVSKEKQKGPIGGVPSLDGHRPKHWILKAFL